jgi:hypothetical protein
MCRDLIFHVQEHRFTLAELDKVLKRHDLSFVAFSYLPPSIINEFKLSHPAPEDHYDLLKWHEYEEKNPDIFAAMYQIWLCRTGDLAKIRSQPKRINALNM